MMTALWVALCLAVGFVAGFMYSGYRNGDYVPMPSEWDPSERCEVSQPVTIAANKPKPMPPVPGPKRKAASRKRGTK